MNGNEKSVFVLSVFYLKQQTPAVLNGNSSIPERYAALRVHLRNSVSSILLSSGHKTLKTKQFCCTAML